MNLYQTEFSCFLFLIVVLGTYARHRGHKHSEGDVRLVGGKVPYEGTVLIYHRSRWGAICDNEWDRKDADVVCKQLGHRYAIKAVYGSQFGKGRGRKWMSTTRCSGYEDSLQYCMFLGWGRMRRGCYGSDRSAGVMCRPHKTTTTSTTTQTTTQTTTETVVTAPPQKDALRQRVDALRLKYVDDKHFAADQLSGLQADAPVPQPRGRNLENRQPGGRNLGNRQPGGRNLGNRQPGGQHSENRRPGLQVRLAGGRYNWEGRLEVRDDHAQWGAICGRNWTLREAIVACRELGQDYGKQALQVNYFGGENLDKHYHQIKCKGRESRLDECEKIHTDVSVPCEKNTLVAGVVCTSRLPDLIPDLEILEQSVRLTDRPLYYLVCSMEENCLSSSAYTIRNTSKNWRSSNRRLLRFSTVVHNDGLEDFRPYRAKSQWEWHDCHMHYHSMEVFAHYDIIDSHGNRLAEGSKASFCLEDSACQPGVVPKFQCQGFRDQGLSVNCSDNYMYTVDCQWIDITDIKPGTYTFKMEINPELQVAELDFDNNVASCELWYSGYAARIHNCRFESLLSV